MKTIKFFFCYAFFTSLYAAPLSPTAFEGNQKIKVQNTILTQVNGTTLSVMDVKKKLDVAFHQAYPQLSDSTMAKFQFYQNSWRQACMELIDQELILADAQDREIQVTDGEVREELENRFGPNVMITLDGIGISYNDAWKMIRNEMTVQRMMWYFIHSKALQNVTPQDIRQEYRRYLKEHPPYQEWSYRVISIRTKEPEELNLFPEELYHLLSEKNESPESLNSFLLEFEQNHPGCTISVSNEYTANHLKLSDAHKAALSSLSPGEYGKPDIQKSRAENKMIARIFYLNQKKDFPAPPFEELAQKLKNDLIQKAIVSESERYITKLRKHYGYDGAHLQESMPDTLNPFSIQ